MTPKKPEESQLKMEGTLDLKKLARPIQKKGKYTNTLNQIILNYQIEQKHIAEVLEIDTATISKHRNGKSPITWDMAQMYSKYFIIQYEIMVDAFTLLTGKHNPKDTIYTDTLRSGKIPLIGQFIHSKARVEMFKHTIPPMYLSSTMYNHYIFKNAEDWGLNSIVYVDGVQTKPLDCLDTFYFEDYHYWVFLNSPIVQKIVHSGSLRNLCICKVKDSDLILAGTLYEKPRRHVQSPITYELVDPYWEMKESFLPPDVNVNGLELEWATPILSVVLNPQASGVKLEKVEPKEDEV